MARTGIGGWGMRSLHSFQFEGIGPWWRRRAEGADLRGMIDRENVNEKKNGRRVAEF